MPISVDDCLNFQRRIRLNHIGSWQIREPDATRQTDSDKVSVLVDLIEQKLGIVVVSEIGGLSVERVDLP
ncbi:hypothetical protein RRSWK_05540 [Rhodopirellula sp. SWK7]|nr:hypothetical protein RRSWK_05540 [Rhodopirellula sp. SWK7]